jgi:hypothetical protein
VHIVPGRAQLIGERDDAGVRPRAWWKTTTSAVSMLHSADVAIGLPSNSGRGTERL